MSLPFATLILVWLGAISTQSHSFPIDEVDNLQAYNIITNTQLVSSIPSEQRPDTLKGIKQIQLIETLSADSISTTLDGEIRTNDEIKNRSVKEILSIPQIEKFATWRYNNKYLTNEVYSIDTNLWMNHLVYPQQKTYESYTHLGNFGSPSQPDHFFSRDNSQRFLFSRFLDSYSTKVGELSQFNVKTPLTTLTYSTGGARSEAEQIFNVFHTQNINKFLNFGASYDFYGTKGVYENQETRNNFISMIGNYYKGNVHAQVSFVNKVFYNKENGGIQDHSFILDTIVEELKFIPVWLEDAESTVKERSISALLGYTLINIKQKDKDSTGQLVESYIPLITSKIILNQKRSSRVFTDNAPDSSFYQNFYINPNLTRDSVLLSSWQVKALIEIAQFAKIPGMPGLRGWLGFDHHRYYYFQPQDFIFSNEDGKVSTSHIGVAAFSESPYFSYRGALRVYLTGYKASDKEIVGDVSLSPWRDPKMPKLKGDILVSESTPDLFMDTYFSNHFKWENDFEKEKRFKIGGVLEAEKWEAEIGYNLMHIQDFLYFNENAEPSQASNVTITSAYIQKNLKFAKGFNFFNRVVWQANTNSQALSVPTYIVFSALFYERVLVKNALTGQLGVNVTYRSRFYADAFNPAIAQFYKQRQEQVGDYPALDLFVNFKWKRALIYIKYEHANKGYPSNQYFATYLHPMNPQVFKFGVSWTFYD
jgi:hypothetical protein